MKLYWTKIILGMLAIFVAGMLVVTAVRKGSHRVRSFAESNSPITIPFPFGIVPFRLDGTRIGTVERLTLYRDGPESISRVRFAVELEDSAAYARLADCVLTVDNPTELNDKTTFACVPADTAGMGLVPFGEVDPGRGRPNLTLLLPESAVNDLRKEHTTDRIEANADSMAEAASRMADSITRVNMDLADSLRSAALERSDSIREAGRRLADSVRAGKLRPGSRP